MNPATAQLIIALLPLAERLIFDLGGKLIELNTKDITSTDELIRTIEESKSHTWPKLKFISGKQIRD